MKTNRHIYNNSTLCEFYNLGFEDISYSNDLCDSIGLDVSYNNEWEEYLQIFLANSHINNTNEELFNTCSLEYYKNCEWVCTIFTTNDISELLSMFKSYEVIK